MLLRLFKYAFLNLIKLHLTHFTAKKIKNKNFLACLLSGFLYWGEHNSTTQCNRKKKKNITHSDWLICFGSSIAQTIWEPSDCLDDSHSHLRGIFSVNKSLQWNDSHAHIFQINKVTCVIQPTVLYLWDSWSL